MRAPHLCRKLVLETSERVSDGAGGFSMAWVPLGVVWGDVASRSGREASHSGAPVTRTGLRITVRGAPVGHIQRPAAQQRFREGARIFTIEAVIEADPAGRYLTCYAQEEQVV